MFYLETCPHRGKIKRNKNFFFFFLICWKHIIEEGVENVLFSHSRLILCSSLRRYSCLLILQAQIKSKWFPVLCVWQQQSPGVKRGDSSCTRTDPNSSRLLTRSSVSKSSHFSDITVQKWLL